jgi:ABC-type Mn2+/Zn2+ transport system ATPase subunit
MNHIVNTNYELINRKLFSLPKILLLPAVMSKQPWLVLQVSPFIMFSDWLKGKVISSLTTKVENFDKEIKSMVAIRTRVESFDLKNAELLQRSGTGATKFTQRQWEKLTSQIQQKRVLSDLYSRTKSFFNFVQHHFIFSALVDCALAHLIALEKITASDIFVFSRAIEDTIDLVLMKSRSEAELARVTTEMDRLQGLADLLHANKAGLQRSRYLLPCHLPPIVSEAISPAIHHHVHRGIVIRNLHYSRGSASVRADHVEIPPGIYALTGANGSGKSTLFRILMSCSSNEKSVDLPESILLSTPAEPLVESDDFFREMSCEADEVSVGGSDNSADGKVAHERQCSAQGECESNAVESETTPNGTTRTLSTSTETTAEKSLLPKPRLSITMPSSRVVEISQTFYWPLYSKPLDWIFEGEQHNFTQSDDETKARLVAEKLQTLEFVQAIKSEDVINSNDSTLPTTEKAILKIMQDLQEEKEDWFGELSGGQKSKVELVRKVFLHEACPHVLLIDETMAPLDPSSKNLVMSHLKAFCQGSVVIVIYHTDAGQNKEDENGLGLVECVPSNSFFDSNIHLEHQMIQLRPIC